MRLIGTKIKSGKIRLSISGIGESGPGKMVGILNINDDEWAVVRAALILGSGVVSGMEYGDAEKEPNRHSGNEPQQQCLLFPIASFGTFANLLLQAEASGTVVCSIPLHPRRVFLHKASATEGGLLFKQDWHGSFPRNAGDEFSCPRCGTPSIMGASLEMVGAEKYIKNTRQRRNTTYFANASNTRAENNWCCSHCNDSDVEYFTAGEKSLLLKWMQKTRKYENDQA
jgi:hypothetical protein